MKRYVTAVVMSVIVASCAKQPCIQGIPERCSWIDISDKYDPVCGCDGVTYRNKSVALCVGGIQDVTPGPCDQAKTNDPGFSY